jgi:hypothetical protein
MAQASSRAKGGGREPEEEGRKGMPFTSRVLTAGRGEVVSESLDSLPSPARPQSIREEEEEEEEAGDGGRGMEFVPPSTPPPARHRYAWSEQRMDISPSTTASSYARGEGSVLSDTESYRHHHAEEGGGRRTMAMDAAAATSARSSADYSAHGDDGGWRSNARSSRDGSVVGRTGSMEVRSGAEALQFLRRQLVKEVRERKEAQDMLAEGEERWRKEVGRSVAVAEEMRALVVSRDAAYDRAKEEAREMRKEASLLREENRRLEREASAAQSREDLAVSRLKELKGASRAAIKRNDWLMAQLEACRVVMSQAGKEGEAVRRKGEAERAREDAVDERRRSAELLAQVMSLKAELKQVAEERDEALGELGRGKGAEEVVSLVERERDEAWEALERERERGEEREAAHKEEVEQLSSLADRLRESLKILSLSAGSPSSSLAAPSPQANGARGGGQQVELAQATRRVGQLENALAESSRRAARLEREVESERLKTRNAELQLEASREALSLAREELGGSFLASIEGTHLGEEGAHLETPAGASPTPTPVSFKLGSHLSPQGRHWQGSRPQQQHQQNQQHPRYGGDAVGAVAGGAVHGEGESEEAKLRREIERVREELEDERCARGEAEFLRDKAQAMLAGKQGQEFSGTDGGIGRTTPPPVELMLGGNDAGD